MSIISVRGNENNRWKKRKKNKTHTKNKNKKNKDRKEQGGTEAIVKGWELNDFVVHSSHNKII